MKIFQKTLSVTLLPFFAINLALAEESDNLPTPCPSGYVSVVESPEIGIEHLQGRRLNADELAQVQAALKKLSQIPIRSKCVPISEDSQTSKSIEATAEEPAVY